MLKVALDPGSGGFVPMVSPYAIAVRVRRFCLILALVLVAFPGAAHAQQQPVLIELFTSEGCSDCPPADDLLTRLDRQQFVPGAQAIVLSEHVTYWNHQGWSDPFSSELMDQRQQQYARRFALSSVYTPQVVVDGAEQFVGSDAGKLQSALEREATKQKLDMKIKSAQIGANGAVTFSVRFPPNTMGKLVAAVAQDATVSRVSGGENAGRILHHVAVVRALKEYDSTSASAGPALTVSGPSLALAERSGAPMRLVVFLVDSGDGKILGAAEQTLHP
jgi:hypothetical protein